MPQMAPLMWVTLFVFFSSSLVLFSIVNYFQTNPTAPSTSAQTFLSSPLSWKW